jgi:hypothetical protein
MREINLGISGNNFRGEDTLKILNGTHIRNYLHSRAKQLYWLIVIII